MDRSAQYTQVMSNFNSAYNGGANYVHRPTMYMPISSSSSFSSQQMHPNLKFNLDLYNPNEQTSESFDYPSPSSSVIIHHHPVYSPPPSQAISKLRQINDELCHTLARCDLDSQPQTPLPHYHIHHYPISPQPSRSPSPSPHRREVEDSSSTESEPTPKKRVARITYKARLPRRPNPLTQADQLLLATSDVYDRDDPMTIDVYPSRDQGFVKRVRNRPDNQQPWLADTSPIRRNSYSETSTYRTPRAPDYDNKPIQTNSRLASGKRRPRSSSVRSRIRPDTVPNVRRSTDFFSSSSPVWRPNGSVKRPKFIGSNAPPRKPRAPPHEPTWTPAGSAPKIKPFRAFDPTSIPIQKNDEPVWNPAGSTTKIKPFRAFDPTSTSIKKKSEPVWNPPSKKRAQKPPRYFEPTMKPALIAPIQKQTAPTMSRKPIIHSANPELKTRIANAESKVKSAWGEPTTTVARPKPPIVPRPTKTITTTTIPPKAKVKPVPSPPIAPVKKAVPVAPPIKTDTGRSSLNDVPTKPMFQSTPRNQSIVNDPDDLFEDEEPDLSEPLIKTEIPHPPPQIEKTPTKLPKTPPLEPDKGTKSTIKDGVLVHGDDRTPSPEVNNNDDEEEEPVNDPSLSPSPIPPEPKAPSPKPNNRDDVSMIDDEDINQTNGNVTEGNAEENSVVNNPVKDDNRTSPPPPPGTATGIDDFFD